MKPKLFKPEQTPTISEGDVENSIDVITVDEDGLMCIAYYSFTEKEWKFHQDTLVDYEEEGNKTKWGWFYSPITKFDIA